MPLVTPARTGRVRPVLPAARSHRDAPEPPARAATPHLRLDIDLAVDRFARLRDALPGTAVHYAVKANPHPELLAALASAGCDFDVASPTEVALAMGADPARLVYSNPVKRREHVAHAAALGVRLFVVDSVAEVDKVAATAPGSAVLCRLATTGAGAGWSLSGKYGCFAGRLRGRAARRRRRGPRSRRTRLPRRVAAA